MSEDAEYDVLGRNAFFDPEHSDGERRAPELREALVVRPTGACVKATASRA